jgi:hypothetical protein
MLDQQLRGNRFGRDESLLSDGFQDRHSIPQRSNKEGAATRIR